MRKSMQWCCIIFCLTLHSGLKLRISFGNCRTRLCMIVEISLATKSKKLQKKFVYLKMLKLSLGLCQKGNIELEGEQQKVH